MKISIQKCLVSEKGKVIPNWIFLIVHRGESLFLGLSKSKEEAWIKMNEYFCTRGDLGYD